MSGSFNNRSNTTHKRQLDVHFAGNSIAGIKAENQDAFAALQPDEIQRHYKGICAVVADGLSSAEKSAEASQLSVTQFIQDYYSTPDSWSIQKSCSRVITALNNWLFQQGQSTPSHACTFSALVIKSHRAYIFHVGDSRIYRFREGELQLLTRDHVRMVNKEKSYLTRALGVDSHLEVDYSERTVKEGDVFMLTSDGVHDYLDALSLAHCLSSADSLEAKSQAIIAACEEAKSQDNITCLLVEVKILPLEALEETHKKLMHMPIPPVLVLGNQLDDYKVLKVLHSGTRSHVYLVEDQIDRAIKVLKAPSINFADDVQYLDAFIREEWVGRKLNHPSLMQTLAPSGERRFRYFLSEYIKGDTLAQWMKDHPEPPLSVVRDLLDQIVISVRVLQRQEMVHRDLKPENFIMTENGRLKLIDFGTVQVAGLAESYNAIIETIPVGSVQYIAPEYLLNNQGRHSSDIFSVGVILYELLTGHLPYTPLRNNQYEGKAYKDWQYKSMALHRPTLAPWIDQVIKKACQPDPAKRYVALSELQHDLKNPPKNWQQQRQSMPLIERDPMLVWKLICTVLLALNIAQFIF